MTLICFASKNQFDSDNDSKFVGILPKLATFGITWVYFLYVWHSKEPQQRNIPFSQMGLSRSMENKPTFQT
jgi:hypothetical protein